MDGEEFWEVPGLGLGQELLPELSSAQLSSKAGTSGVKRSCRRQIPNPAWERKWGLCQQELGKGCRAEQEGAAAVTDVSAVPDLPAVPDVPAVPDLPAVPGCARNEKGVQRLDQKSKKTIFKILFSSEQN